jgi:hypothetical protein
MTGTAPDEDAELSIVDPTGNNRNARETANMGKKLRNAPALANTC